MLCATESLNRDERCCVVLAMMQSPQFSPLFDIVGWLGYGFVMSGANTKGFLNARSLHSALLVRWA